MKNKYIEMWKDGMAKNIKEIKKAHPQINEKVIDAIYEFFEQIVIDGYEINVDACDQMLNEINEMYKDDNETKH